MKITNNLNWKIGGEAGHGIMSSGMMLARTCSRSGLHAFMTSEYPSLIRGGHNVISVRIGEKELHSFKEEVDILVALNKETIEVHLNELAPGAGIIYDGDEIKFDKKDLKGKNTKLFSVPLAKIVKGLKAPEIVRNTVSVGATIALMGFDFARLSRVISATFSSKGEAIIQTNIKAAQAGYDHVKKNYPEGLGCKIRPQGAKKRMLLAGNDAFCLGAIKSGVKFISEYPMTPSSSILHFMAGHERKFNLVVKHTEDEIAAINMAIGAAFTGVRALTATSGGGFSLMAEAIGLAGMSETPVVIVEAQRTGPSTGLPTWTEQSDLKFVLNVSHGEYPKIVLAPGDVEECFYSAIDAFNLAEKYQLPVIILFDRFLSESIKSVDRFNTKGIKIERGPMLTDAQLRKMKLPPGKEFKRYKFTNTGVSPRVFPGQPNAIFKATGNEHDETGMLTEEPPIRTKMMDKRMKKLEFAAKEIKNPVKVHGPSKANVTIVGWGSTKGSILEAMKLLEKEGIKANFLQILFVRPFPAKRVSDVLKRAKKTVIVENNKTAQMAGVIKENTGLDIDHKVLKYDGRPFSPEGIFAKIRKLVR